MTNIEKIKAACIKANPEIIVERDNFKTDFARPIRLADVLLAMNHRNLMVGLMCTGGFYNFLDKSFFTINSANSVWWDLKHDSLTDQSPETIEFIASLLA